VIAVERLRHRGKSVGSARVSISCAASSSQEAPQPVVLDIDGGLALVLSMSSRFFSAGAQIAQNGKPTMGERMGRQTAAAKP